MTRTAVGYFRHRASADAAYDDLVRSGFGRDDVSIMGQGREGGTGLADDDHVGAGEGAAVGGITGLLLGAAAMLIPGIGPIVAVGPLAAGLAGAVTGAATGVVVGGITGALTDAGVDHDTSAYYDERFKQGGYLLTVRANDVEYEKARMILERHDGDVRSGTATAGSAPAATAPTRTAGTTAGWDTAMPGYRSRRQERYGSSGGRWEEYEPSFGTVGRCAATHATRASPGHRLSPSSGGTGRVATTTCPGTRPRGQSARLGMRRPRASVVVRTAVEATGGHMASLALILGCWYTACIYRLHTQCAGPVAARGRRQE